MIYKFFDRDYYLNDGCFAITGNHYKELIRICFQYCAYFSVNVYRQTEFLRQLDPWHTTELIPTSARLDSSKHRQFYLANSETCTLLMQYTDSFFKKRLLPSEVFFEDFTFLRADFSVFFEEISHEGECTLYPRNNEDISLVIRYGHWLPCNDEHIPVIPAEECTLPSLTNYALENDYFYQLLLAVQTRPEKYIPERTMDMLERFINGFRPSCDHPLSNSKNAIQIPMWYTFFEIYVLRKCKALTTTPLALALMQNGYTGEAAFNRFFELLRHFKKESGGQGA